jgi:hypothetical protein
MHLSPLHAALRRAFIAYHIYPIAVEQALQSKLTALSNAAKFAHAAAQGTSAIFPGKGKIYCSYLHLISWHILCHVCSLRSSCCFLSWKDVILTEPLFWLPTFDFPGSSSLSLSNSLAQKPVAPTYKKTLRANQGQFKLGTNRNLAWLKPVSSDNLVINFSDEDSETDSGLEKQHGSKSTKASSQVTHKTGITMQTRIVREEAHQQKTHAANLGSAKWSANPHTLRNSGAGRSSSATFSRRDPPIRQAHLKSTQKDGNGAGVNSADDKLESLRHKIAARENELKVQKRPMSPGFVKDANLSSDQTRPSLEKIGFEASNSGGCVHPDDLSGHDDRPAKRLKPNQQCIDNQASGDLVTLVPTGSSLGNDNLISSGRRDHMENEITMNCTVNETEQATTTELSDQMYPSGAAKNLLPSKSHHMVIQDGGNHATVEYHGKPAVPPFTSDQSMAEDTSALVPVTSVRTGADVEKSSNHAKDHMISTSDGQHVKPAGVTVSNERPHLQPGMKVGSALLCPCYVLFYCSFLLYGALKSTTPSDRK